MNFVRVLARLARRGCSRAVAPIAVRAVLVTAGLALAGIAFAAGPAQAADPQFPGMWELQSSGAIDQNTGVPTCLDADAGDPSNFGPIFQWDCAFSTVRNPGESLDPYQVWTATDEGNGLYLLENVGAATCADADAQDVGSGGAIIQWSACNSSDPFELFSITPTGGNTYSVKSYGASNVSIGDGGPALCLDADYNNGHINDGTPIIQYPCNTADSFQLWNFYQITSINS
jgi:hypothetical protein